MFQSIVFGRLCSVSNVEVQAKSTLEGTRFSEMVVLERQVDSGPTSWLGSPPDTVGLWDT